MCAIQQLGCLSHISGQEAMQLILIFVIARQTMLLIGLLENHAMLLADGMWFIFALAQYFLMRWRLCV
jgi:hypothetical protein